MRKKVWIGLVIGLLSFPGYAQSNKNQWVDSVFNTFDLPEKIGQLLMVSVNSYADEAEIKRIESLIKNYGIGGIVFVKGGPVTQVNLTNHFQKQSLLPMLIGMNAEEGVGAVLDSTVQFASPLMLGSIRNDSALYFVGEEIGRQLNQLGAHINFAPTANLSMTLQNENLLNTSYGEDRELVAGRVVRYQQGLQKMNVLSVAKYYPDHGMRVQGFQKGIPVITSEDDPNRLLPLQKLFENGCAGVVTAYEQDLIFPQQKKLFTPRKTMISTAIPTLYSGDYLKRQLNFQGLVFSVIPDIQELNKKFRAGDAEVFAFKAGNDVLLFPENIPATVRKMRRSIKKNSALQKQLNESVKKVLAVKYDATLYKNRIIATENLITRLNTPAALALQLSLFEKSITVVKDDEHLLPVRLLENITFASVSIGAKSENEFTSILSKYAPFTHVQLQTVQDTGKIVQSLQHSDIIVAAVYPNATELESVYPQLLQKLSEHSKVIVVEFGPPSKISLVEQVKTILQAYSDHEVVQKIIPQILFGAAHSSGMLPISINERIAANQGLVTTELGRLGYATAETVELNSRTLEGITKIAEEAIARQTTPGCQIIVARKGKIVYEKSFGAQTYDNLIPINDESIYDLASVTKVAATLQVTMFLYEKGLLDIYKKASCYLPELLHSDKKDIIIKDILTHQAGLTPFVPFWINTVKDSLFLPEYYSLVKNEQYPWQVAPNLFAVKSLRDSLWSWSIKSKMRIKPPRTPYNYVYSDVGLYILHHLNDKLLNQPQEEFLQQNLYEPLGAATMGYLPLERFEPDRIVPTENDKLFRKALLLGTAHDEGAAMLGGVAGHAGLFGNAHDLAKLGQMLLQKGYYGGQQYFKPETVNYFTSKQFDTSRRGLGWDKPVQSEWNSPTSIFASPETFGHTGFTGTCIWVDPKFELVYVFLSNRVYPDRSNTKLSTLNIRSRIQDVIYQSIFEYCQYGSPLEKSIQFIKQ